MGQAPPERCYKDDDCRKIQTDTRRGSWKDRRHHHRQGYRQALNSPVVFHERSSDEYLLNTVKVGTRMTQNPLTIGPDEDILKAAELMEQHKIGGLPVVGEGLIVGIIPLSDLINHLIRQLRQSQKSQRPDA